MDKIMTVVTTSSRGQIVIPRDVRKKRKSKKEKKILIRAEEDRAILFPLPNDPAEHFCDVFQEGSSLIEALMAERKKERKCDAKKIA